MYYMGTKVIARDDLLFSVHKGAEYFFVPKMIYELNDSLELRSVVLHFQQEP